MNSRPRNTSKTHVIRPVIAGVDLAHKEARFTGDIGVFWRESTDHRNQKTAERRRSERVEQYFECTWLGDWAEESARVSSLSTSGCYIDSRSAVPQLGTALTMTIKLPTGEISAQGTVVSAMRGVGFAVQFTGLDDDTHARLSAL